MHTVTPQVSYMYTHARISCPFHTHMKSEIEKVLTFLFYMVHEISLIPVTHSMVKTMIHARSHSGQKGRRKPKKKKEKEMGKKVKKENALSKCRYNQG